MEKTSRFESLTRRYINFVLPDDEKLFNYRPDWLKNWTGSNLEIDIFLKNRRVGIEVNGAGHFLKDQRERDVRKNQLCEINGVRLITISKAKDIFSLFYEITGQELSKQIPKSLSSEIIYYTPSKASFPELRQKLKKKSKKRGRKNKRILRRPKRKTNYITEVLIQKKELSDNLKRMFAKGLVTKSDLKRKIEDRGLKDYFNTI